MPVHTYTNWNSRPSDQEEQIEPFRKYYFICEGANTETFYTLSFPKTLAAFAEQQKKLLGAEFDTDHDRMIIAFDADIFEDKVQGYDDLIAGIERTGNVPGVSNPGFELFLLLHTTDAYEKYIKGHEAEFLKRDEANRFGYAYKRLLEVTGMNAKKNSKIGELARDISTAIEQEKLVNQDVHNVKGKVSSNLASIIESIMAESPQEL